MKLGLTWGQYLGKPECPYMRRWVINMGRLGSLRLHHWYRSDDKRYQHDHPADFYTLVLKGSYVDWELTDRRCPWCASGICAQLKCANGYMLRFQHMKLGSFAFRKAEHRHTVAVDPGGCWTLLYFFPDRRKWGFWVPRKIDGKLKFKKSNKYFIEHGHHPCDHP